MRQNELATETEPYSECYKQFLGRGPTAAALYAQTGKRPKLAKQASASLQALIERCWAADASTRPTFDEIVAMFGEDDTLSFSSIAAGVASNPSTAAEPSTAAAAPATTSESAAAAAPSRP